ncbi:MAG TPA: nitronate monooxygenase [Solirubrobacteraceae bacterium]|nr:nitronate monooxygenase [Solirubrobacteraceae bacterium]
MPFELSALEHPIVQAPMGGGPSTPALAAAVCEAGGLGFLAAGYKAVDAVAADVAEVRSLTNRPFGVNLFAPPAPVADPGAVARYAASLGPDAGEPRHDDDGWQPKLELLARERVAVASFTFGCPTDGVVGALHDAGCAAWVTVTTADEARHAASVGADALVVQGVEAGGHRGSFDDDAPGEIGLLALLQLVGAAVDLPLVATGGVATGRAVAAVLAAGAAAAGLGSAFMLAPEAATSAPHADALRSSRPTALTRAFTGRLARGITNRFMAEHGAGAPRAYPDVHYVTAPLRAAARTRGDAEAINLWAGQAYELAPRDEPAGDIVRRLSAEARAALRDAAARYGA